MTKKTLHLEKLSLARMTACVLCLMFSMGARADIDFWQVLNHTAAGFWVGMPLGASERVGMAISIDREVAITAGNEFGTLGTKQFLGVRDMGTGHGVIWGALDIAHWKTRSDPWFADKHSDYYGIETQLAFFGRESCFPPGVNASGSRLEPG